MRRFFRYQTRLPEGGEATTVSEQDLKEYDYVITRPRWMILLTFIFLFYAALFTFIVRKQPEGSDFVVHGLAIVFGMLSAWTAIDMILPKRWRFVLAIGPKGVLVSQRWYDSKLTLFPWSQVKDFKRLSYVESGNPRNLSITMVSFKFQRGLWNVFLFYSISEKKLVQLAEKYLSPENRYFARP